MRPRIGETLPPPRGRGREHYSRELKLGAVFPDKLTSRSLTWGNLFFAIRNPGFVFFLAMAYGLFLWMLESRTGRGSLLGQLHGTSLCESVARLYAMIVAAPEPSLLLLLSFAGYYYFADARTRGRQLMMGLMHGAVQTAAATLAVVGVSRRTRTADRDERARSRLDALLRHWPTADRSRAGLGPVVPAARGLAADPRRQAVPARRHRH